MNTRTLHVDFEKYTDGDADFKAELIKLMIDNLNELYDAVAVALMCRDYTTYRKTCHKVNSTITMLNDQELCSVIDDIKNDPGNKEKSSNLLQLCAAIADSLSRQAQPEFRD